MPEMIQEIERLEDDDGIVFGLGKTPQPKTHHTAGLGKVAIIGYKEPRGAGDDCFYIIQFEKGAVLRLYNPKHVLFGQPKPQIQKANAGEVLALTGKTA